MISKHDVESLLSAGLGDTERLKFILESIEQQKTLYQSDIRYVQNLLSLYAPKPNPPQALQTPNESTDQLNETPLAEQTPDISQMPQDAPVYRGSEKYKSRGVALCLSFLGFLGFFGLGHRYVGNIWRSLGLLYLGWALVMLNFLGAMPLAISNLSVPLGLDSDGIHWPILLEILGYQHGAYPAAAIALIVVSPIAFFATLIWQAVNAQTLCKKYNTHMDMTGGSLYMPTKTQKAAFILIATIPAIALVLLMATLAIMGLD
ncbi:MAG: hypothetical protein QXG67_03655 [Candidatus Nitrosotenuis sp.]